MHVYCIYLGIFAYKYIYMYAEYLHIYVRVCMYECTYLVIYAYVCMYVCRYLYVCTVFAHI